MAVKGNFKPGDSAWLLWNPAVLRAAYDCFVWKLEWCIGTVPAFLCMTGAMIYSAYNATSGWNRLFVMLRRMDGCGGRVSLLQVTMLMFCCIAAYLVFGWILQKNKKNLDI